MQTTSALRAGSPSVCLQGSLLQAMHSQWMSSSHHVQLEGHSQQHLVSGTAATDGGTAAVGEESAAMRAALQEDLDERLWPLEALLQEAAGKILVP